MYNCNRALFEPEQHRGADQHGDDPADAVLAHGMRASAWSLESSAPRMFDHGSAATVGGRFLAGLVERRLVSLVDRPRRPFSFCSWSRTIGSSSSRRLRAKPGPASIASKMPRGGDQPFHGVRSRFFIVADRLSWPRQRAQSDEILAQLAADLDINRSCDRFRRLQGAWTEVRRNVAVPPCCAARGSAGAPPRLDARGGARAVRAAVSRT